MKNSYIISTLGYGVVGVIGLVGTIYFLKMDMNFLAFLSLLIVVVASDNFFCSCRARSAGLKTGKGHYMFPKFS